MISLLLGMMLASGPDLPRPAGETRKTTIALNDLQACVTRMWSPQGNVTPIPINGGVALDWQMRSISLAGPGKAVLTFEIRDTGSERGLAIAYRHPFSAKLAIRSLDDTVKRCFPAANQP